MLAAFAVAKRIHDQHQAAQAGPGHAHVLQLALRLGIVMAGDDEEARHLVAERVREVEIGRGGEARPGFENEVLGAEAFASVLAGDACVQVGGRFGKLPQRGAKLRQAWIAKFLPVGARLDAAPAGGFMLVCFLHAPPSFARQHLAGFLLLRSLGRDRAGVEIAQRRGGIVLATRGSRQRANHQDAQQQAGAKHGKPPGR